METIQSTQEDYEKINKLVKRGIGGDNKAIEELLITYKNMIFNIARTYNRSSRCSLEEFISDLNSQFFIFLKEYKVEDNVFFPYYIRTKLHWYAYSQLVYRLRYEKTNKPLLFLTPEEESAVSLFDDSAIKKLMCEEVLKYIDKNYSRDKYKIFYLYYYEGYTQKEISNIIGETRWYVFKILHEMKANVVSAIR